MELQTEYLEALHNALEINPAVKAAWLSGSFGRGNADRYSDIDINVWLDDADVDKFRQAAETWLGVLRPLVLFRWMFNNRMANVLTADGLRIDLWLFTDTPTLDPNSVKVLLDRDNALQFETSASMPNSAALKSRLLDQIREFWRCIAMTPVVAGRNELLVGLFGLNIDVTVLSDVLITGYGIARDSGVKRLNPFLPDALRVEIEQAVSIQGLTVASLTQATLALARIMQREGRLLAARHSFEYPEELETAVLAYTKGELATLGVVE